MGRRDIKILKFLIKLSKKEEGMIDLSLTSSTSDDLDLVPGLTLILVS